MISSFSQALDTMPDTFRMTDLFKMMGIEFTRERALGVGYTLREEYGCKRIVAKVNGMSVRMWRKERYENDKIDEGLDLV